MHCLLYIQNQETEENKQQTEVPSQQKDVAETTNEDEEKMEASEEVKLYYLSSTKVEGGYRNALFCLFVSSKYMCSWGYRLHCVLVKIQLWNGS